MNRRQFLQCASALVTAPMALPAAENVAFTSTADRVAVMELFTSEGCSSCPPAEEWFSSLKKAPGLWTRFIPIAFHVDYWDYLGWKDELASKEATRRQNQYAAAWRSNRIYTPCFVLNGDEWQGRHLELPKSAESGVLALKGDAAQGVWGTHFEPKSARIVGMVHHVALLGSVVSKVKAGENAGRMLTHDFAMLSQTSMACENGRAVLKLAPDRRATVVVAWVSRGADPTPLQAVAGRL